MTQRSQRQTEKEAAALASDHEEIVDAIYRRGSEAAERRLLAYIHRLLTGTLAYIDRIGGS